MLAGREESSPRWLVDMPPLTLTVPVNSSAPLATPNRRYKLRRLIFLATAVLETVIIVLTPRILINDRGIFRTPGYTGSLASVADVRSIAVYGIGALIVAALCYWATGPAVDPQDELRADLASARRQIDILRADLDAVTENLTEPGRARAEKGI